ncbi:rhamnogalacturonan acetylesterase [Pontibacter sp. BAB1700]|uniref:rhamnogalacturonan acetylesterase n=1 Tax=Pontibacter sp. BAB1700 TaxID=1144253 RepID=UPI00026BC94C|nr:G-D-S-L family lipolytic protein [Pontibacter sp. BAB1700]
MKIFLLLAATFLMSFFPAQQQKPIKVYLIGDSTISIKETKAYPETGWGMPFVYFFDSSVTVDNRAKNGRSTRTFIEEGLWQPVSDQLQAGDYVFIQFGHNDEVETKKSYTPKDQYRANLDRFITEAQKKKATPVLLTPAARRQFDEAGKIVGTHEEYAAIVRDVASQRKVALIDWTEKARTCCSNSVWKARSICSCIWSRASTPTTRTAKKITPTLTNMVPAWWRSWCWPKSKPRS